MIAPTGLEPPQGLEIVENLLQKYTKKHGSWVYHRLDPNICPAWLDLPYKIKNSIKSRFCENMKKAATLNSANDPFSLF